MVIVRVQGGLGNQLFQYAAGLALSRKLDAELAFDLGFYPDKRFGRTYGLNPYVTDPLVISPESRRKVEKYGTQRPGISRRLARKFGARYDRHSLVETGLRPHDAKGWDRLRAPCVLNGYFQSEQYFFSIASEVKERFGAKPVLTPAAKEWLKWIGDRENPVSLHVRRGDYLHNPEVRKHFLVCDDAWYARAIDRMAERLRADLELFVFSDEPEWVAENFSRVARRPFTVFNGTTMHEDLYLMSRCRHHIISNSSFGWWGAWLNPLPEKHVIAPARWTSQDSGDQASEIVPEAWHRLA